MIDTAEKLAKFLTLLGYSSSDVEATVQREYPTDNARDATTRAIAHRDQVEAQERDLTGGNA